jgi:uncharacterized protein
MNFVVYCLDHPGMVQRRLDHYEAHKAYLQTSPVRTLISGPLTELDGTMIGSFFLYEGDDIEASGTRSIFARSSNGSITAE